jgi:hypothetical protein
MDAKMEDIILVTGCHRTRAWANFASDRAQGGSRISLGVGITDAGANVHWGLLYNSTNGGLNTRPTDHPPANGEVGDTQLQGLIDTDVHLKVPPENDCILIRGFRVKRNCFGMVQRVRGAAEPKPDPRKDNREPEMGGVPTSTVPEVRISALSGFPTSYVHSTRTLCTNY